MTRATAKRGVAGIHMRHLNRGKLLTALESDNLVKRVVVAEGERLRIEQVPWDVYWEPVLKCGEDLDNGRIGRLHQAWRTYILSGHEVEYRQEYCFRYFDLLEAVLKSCQANPGCMLRDLRPVDLARHYHDFEGLHGSSARDMTRAMGLRGLFSYAMCNAGDPHASSLKGERLW